MAKCRHRICRLAQIDVAPNGVVRKCCLSKEDDTESYWQISQIHLLTAKITAWQNAYETVHNISEIDSG
jgi:hypothetical protein